MLFQGLSLRLPVARNEKELKHVCQVVKQGKALYNENPVEFIPGEGKPRLSIPIKMNERFPLHLAAFKLRRSSSTASNWPAGKPDTRNASKSSRRRNLASISMEMTN
ncbi:conserved hypothetical protein, partial [Trichinella spiralis]|uniref:hypothetical protein n=1 Tax=Trichinella spiralis TaxID=6334 RepID=UPI0001EFDACE